MSQIQTLDDVYNLLQNKNVNIEDIYSYVHPKKTKNKIINVSLGRIWFNLLLSDDFPYFVDEPVNKSVLTRISNEIYNKFPPDKAAEILSLILKESFKLSSIHPVTFDIDSLIIPNDIRQKKELLINKDTPPEEFGRILKSISTDYLEDHMKDSGVYNIIESGAKGSAVEFGVLTVAKGPTMDIEGNISKPITSALMDGYSGEEYYTAAAEARRGLYIRAIGTAEPGALAREVTFANANTTLDLNDCGSHKYLELFIKEDIFPTIIGRYYINQKTGKLVQITRDMNKLINTTIKLRSPLYCKSLKGICKVCYGELADKMNTKNIGLVSGSVINAAGVEGYSMKARHQATQVNLKHVDFTQDMIQI